MKDAIHLDLVQLASVLKEEGRHPQLVKAIERAAAIGSIREDLQEARSSLLLIGRLQDQAVERPMILPVGDEATTIAGVLFTQAVMLYARATFTSGDRPSLLGSTGLSSEQRMTEEEVKMLRNKAFAHFGRGEEFREGPLVKEAVVFSFNRTQRRISVYTTRSQHKTAFTESLLSLTETRLEQVAERFQKLFDELDARLDEALKADPPLGGILPRFQFAPDAFSSSPEAAGQIRDQLKTGLIEDMDFMIAVPKT